MSGSGRFCGGCGQELKQGARFCGVCGHSAPVNSRHTVPADEEGLPTPTRHVTASRPRAAAPQPFNLTPPARESAESSERSFDEVGSSPRRASGPSSSALDGTGPRVVHQRRPRWPIALGLVLLLALGVTAAIYLLAPRSHTIVPSGSSKSQEASSTPSSSTSSPETTSAPTAPGSADISRVASDSDAAGVARAFGTYFGGIDGREYAQAYAVYSPSAQSHLAYQSWANALSTTNDSAVSVTSMSHNADGSLSVAVDFTSHQSPSNGPNPGESCTNWSLIYDLVPNSNGSPPYLIDQVSPNENGGHLAC
jgi:hypothetical protein